jgi:hypothetical protein
MPMTRDLEANPFSPGSPRPRRFVGREAYIEDFEVSLAKWESDGTAPPTILLGVPGVGKSALLNRFADIAQGRGWLVAQRQKVTARTDLRRLFGQAFAEVEAQLIGGKTLNRRAQELLTRFKEVRVQSGFLGVTVGRVPSPPAGSLEQDLTSVLIEMANLTRTLPVLFVLDELQFLPEDSLRAVIYAFDELANRVDPATGDRFAVTMVAAGLPQAKAMCRKAGQYAERFNYPWVRELDREETLRAFRETAQLAADDFTEDAAARGYELTGGYPQFIQVYGELAWLRGVDSPISLRDMQAVAPVARARLEESFFSTRLTLATPEQQDLLMAMARLVVESGAKAQTLTNIAHEMGRPPSSITYLFAPLVTKGLLYQPRPRGPYEMTVPKFADYLVSLEP